MISMDNREDGKIRPLFEMGTETPAPPEQIQEIENRIEEGKRVVKRLTAIYKDHQQAAIPLKIKLGHSDLRLVIDALKKHAKGEDASPVAGARDEIHGYCLNRLFEELVVEPSNILFTTKTGPDTIRYDAMNPTFWTECLDLLESSICSEKE
jgi:hypothetical protein